MKNPLGFGSSFTVKAKIFISQYKPNSNNNKIKPNQEDSVISWLLKGSPHKPSKTFILLINKLQMNTQPAYECSWGGDLGVCLFVSCCGPFWLGEGKKKKPQNNKAQLKKPQNPPKINPKQNERRKRNERKVSCLDLNYRFKPVKCDYTATSSTLQLCY